MQLRELAQNETLTPAALKSVPLEWEEPVRQRFSNLFLWQDPFTLLKIIKDLKEFASVDYIYHYLLN